MMHLANENGLEVLRFSESGSFVRCSDQAGVGGVVVFQPIVM